MSSELRLVLCRPVSVRSTVAAAAAAFAAGVLGTGATYAFAAHRSPAEPEAAPSGRTGEVVTIPQAQAELCEIVAGRASEYRAARRQNELRRSAIREARRRDLLALSPHVDEWVGTITDLGTNGDGKAYLSVKVLCARGDVTVHTWTMAVTDAADETLLPPSSELFDTLSSLSPGARLRFSGDFIAGDEANGWRETSFTERGGMRAPELVFRFTSIARP